MFIMMLPFVLFFDVIMFLGAQHLSPNTLCPLHLEGEALKRCENLSADEQMKSVKWLETPRRTVCRKVSIVHGISVCEDNLKKGDCTVLSVVVSNDPVEIAQLLFEQEWSKHCKVTVINYFAPFNSKFKYRKVNDNFLVHGRDTWAKRAYSALFLDMPLVSGTIDVFKIQVPDIYNAADPGSDETAKWQIPNPIEITTHSLASTQGHDGAQYSMFAGLYFNTPEVMNRVNQVIMQSSFSQQTLIDYPGGHASHGLNMWAAVQLLKEKSFSAFRTQRLIADPKLLPHQVYEYLYRAEIDSEFYFVHSYMKQSSSGAPLSDAINQHNTKVVNWAPKVSAPLLSTLPSWCSPPTVSREKSLQEMHQWVEFQLNARCNPVTLTVPCHFKVKYQNFLRCPQEQMDNLAFDYAASKGWCDFAHPDAAVPAFTTVPTTAIDSFQHMGRHNTLPPDIKPNHAFSNRFPKDAATQLTKKPVKLAFSLIVHSDLSLLKHPWHQDDAFVNGVMNTLAYPSLPNVFVSRDVPMVYMSSTTTMVMVKGMAWFAKHIHDWDYFVSLTGSDYPLMPLDNIEKVLHAQQPPMPFLMLWTSGVSKFMHRMTNMYPIYDKDATMKVSMEVLKKDRGSPMGSQQHSIRAANYGPPLTCKNGKSFHRLDARKDYDGAWPDTQWLFPKEARYRRYAITWQTEAMTDTYANSSDNVFRLWRKHDPSFSAAYDRQSVDYIVDSLEGRKYFHFFSKFLMSSEEHYIGSLLYNNPRTSQFLATLKAEAMWTTWGYGLAERHADGLKFHCRFLTPDLIDALEGMSKRGVFFARKFSTVKTPEILDMIDERLLRLGGNGSALGGLGENKAGMYWPGHAGVDVDVDSSKDQFNAMLREKRRSKLDSPFKPL